MCRRLLALLALLALTAGLAGCGQVRLDSPGATAPPPSAAEELRQHLAQGTQLLGETAADAAVAEPDLAALLGGIGSDASLQLEALGGVWTPSGRFAAGPLPHGGSTRVLALLLELAAKARTAVVDGVDSQSVTLLAGLSVSWALRADQLAVALGGQQSAVELTAPTRLDATTSRDLIRTLDALGWAWEVTAARAEGEARSSAVATAERWRAQAQQIAEIAGVAGTDDDPREVSYALDVADLPGAVATLERSLVPAWLAQIATTDAADRAAVLDEALLAARAAGLADATASPPPVVVAATT